MSAIDTPLKPAASRSTPFRRISDADALRLYYETPIHDLGRMAFARLMELHPEPYRTYVIDRNINYSNICTAKCIFCNFKADPGDAEAYTLTFEQIGSKIEELIDIGGTQILMQGGLVPDEHDPSGDGLPFQWYLDLLQFIRKNYPEIHIHAFSPPEIWAMHVIYKMSLRDVICRLRDAGLATIPGGGGEILVDRIRNKIGRGKTIASEWLEVMRVAHQLGMKTSCTMMYGHIETIEERFEHMRLLRDLQDEGGGFTAFIHWPFQPENTPLGRMKQRPIAEGDRVSSVEGRVSSEAAEGRKSSEGLSSTRNSALAPRTSSAVDAPRFARPDYLPDGQHLMLADSTEYLRMLAIARLYFDNIPNIQSSWVTMGPKIGQLALFFGANDMGSVMMEENVVSAAGATYRLDEETIRRLITDAGWTPQQRDQYYNPITRAKRVPTVRT
ncbi:MAG: radical SAM protein [Phycisphaerae bacterium]|nr:radical SAM protein [Phycisphaerae bacterium]